MEHEKIQPCGGWWAAPVPGFAMTEVAVHDAALDHDAAAGGRLVRRGHPGVTGEAVDIDRALPEMHAVASRLTPTSWQHPGQITWSARYALPEDLDHGPVRVFHADGLPVGWAWVESPDWMEWCVDPAYAGVAEEAVAWFLATTSASTVRTSTLATEPHLVAALEAAGFVDGGDPLVQPAHPRPAHPSARPRRARLRVPRRTPRRA